MSPPTTDQKPSRTRRGRRTGSPTDDRDAPRARILDTTEAMLREGGAASLSMRALAQRSDVGHVTPYKLFGSKHAVLRGVLDRVFGPLFARLVPSPSEDPVEGLMSRLEPLFDVLGSDEPFMRELLAALDEATPAESRSQWVALASKQLGQDLARLRATGFVRADAPLDLVVDQLVVGHAGAFRRWILRLSTFDRYCLECRAVTLTAALAIASESGRVRLWPRLLALERESDRT